MEAPQVHRALVCWFLKQYLFHSMCPINMSSERMPRETRLGKWHSVRSLKNRKPRALVSDTRKANNIRIKFSVWAYYVTTTEVGAGDSVKEKQVMLRRQL